MHLVLHQLHLVRILQPLLLMQVRLEIIVVQLVIVHLLLVAVLVHLGLMILRLGSVQSQFHSQGQPINVQKQIYP